MPKVFCIGFHKTGTTSLTYALRRLGYSVTGPNGNRDPDIAKKLKPLVRQLSQQYDAFQDNPWPVVFPMMDRLHPGSKFILTIRNEDDWLRSCLSFFGEDSSPMREMIYGAGAGSPIGNEEIYRQRYRRHNTQVRNHFRDRPDDLLIMDMDEGFAWAPLCRFLGHPVPDEPFPHANPRRMREDQG